MLRRIHGAMRFLPLAAASVSILRVLAKSHRSLDGDQLESQHSFSEGCYWCWSQEREEGRDASAVTSMRDHLMARQGKVMAQQAVCSTRPDPSRVDQELPHVALMTTGRPSFPRKS